MEGRKQYYYMAHLCLKASLAIDKTWYSFFIRWCDAMLLLYPIAIAFWEFIFHIYLYMFIVVLTLLLDFGLLLLFETKEFLYLLSGNWNTRLLLFSLSLFLSTPPFISTNCYWIVELDYTTLPTLYYTIAIVLLNDFIYTNQFSSYNSFSLFSFSFSVTTKYSLILTII